MTVFVIPVGDLRSLTLNFQTAAAKPALEKSVYDLDPEVEDNLATGKQKKLRKVKKTTLPQVKKNLLQVNKKNCHR